MVGSKEAIEMKLAKASSQIGKDIWVLDEPENRGNADSCTVKFQSTQLEIMATPGHNVYVHELGANEKVDHFHHEFDDPTVLSGEDVLHGRLID